MATTCESRKIDSNISGLAIAEEECLMQLPAGVAAVAATGTVTFTGAGADGDTLVINGVTKTLKTTPAGANDVQIGGTAAATATNMLVALASVVGIVASANTATELLITAAAPGVSGNTIAMVRTGTAITLSGATLTGGADETSAAIWYRREPNSYSDFGGDVTTTARSPIDPSRQNKKGTPTDLDASGGFNEDFTKSNFTRVLQGFFFADARENKGTAPLNAAQIPVTAVSASKYSAASAGFSAGMLVFASGFAAAANNGIKTGTAGDATGVTVAEALTVDAAPLAEAKVIQVGRHIAVGDCAVVMVGNIATLQLTAGTWTANPEFYYPGRWLYIGGDGTNTRFNNNKGFARISRVTDKQLYLDDTTWAPVAEGGAGKTLHIYSGTVIRNEKEPALIKRRSYQLERTLGEGPNGTQAQYLEGAVSNELTLNIPQAEKLNADLSFVACNDTQRSGDPGDTIKPGTRVNAPNEDAYNSSSNVVRIKMTLHDDTTSNPRALFGYITEGNVSINNGITPNKAVGVFGAFDTSAGNFTVAGSLTVYFQTVEAIRAVRNNADVGVSMIVAARNAGFLVDIPLVGLGGGRPNVEKDSPITLPLTPNGAENKWGYTMQYQAFEYLPKIAMP